MSVRTYVNAACYGVVLGSAFSVVRCRDERLWTFIGVAVMPYA